VITHRPGLTTRD